MSIDLNWETLTTGPDGEALAAGIRDFIHAKFQTVPLPRFIKSVNVHAFEFGSIPPELELKDITDPLPDFYEENPDIDDDEDEDENEEEGPERHSGGIIHGDSIHVGDDGDYSAIPAELRAAERRRRAHDRPSDPHHLPPHIHTGPLWNPSQQQPHDLGSPFLGVSTPGIPGGTSNLNYFHAHLAPGLSGTHTPLAAVAGAHLGNSWLESALASHAFHSSPELHHFPASDSHEPTHSRNPSQSSISVADFSTVGSLTPASAGQPGLKEKHSVSTLAPTSAGTSRPPTRDTAALAESAIIDDQDDGDAEGEDGQGQQQRRFRERRIEDIQAVFRIRYAGDVKLRLTADILLDYPMPSFVGIPVQLSITGLTFDGVGVVAYIRKRIHFCFLSPDDALAAVGADNNNDESSETTGTGGVSERRTNTARLGGLLQEIRVESEIGQRESGKQSLKNVGKVERFVLEQVRRIFEEEFVYPSFWTFLV